ncbi:MAG TPA: alpha/beta hydrolase [Solirubrobacterales bacterium]|jgi:pimeloyl-ACP methyl ester carboxylesterase|nr:alpha/beta hydrolase [Solirubrobacterales bacterium]
MGGPPHVDGIGHRSVRARGLDFHVAEAGGGEDVVLCLHGWPQHWYEWRHLMPALADRHRVLALDLRGFGWSDAPPDGYEKENLADDVLAVLDELGIERVKLVGHDWGGWIGFLLCLRAPQRFERYLALNILHPWVSGARAALPHAWRFTYQLVIMTPVVGYELHRRRRFVPRVLVAGSTRKDAWDEATLRAFSDNLAEPDRARAAVQLYRVFQLRELLPVLRGRYQRDRLTVPTRLLFGIEDAVLKPELLDGYERHADEMSVELVPNCGHFIADEMPELVAERARDFFAP